MKSGKEGQESVAVTTNPVMDLSIPEAAKDLANLVILFYFLAVKKVEAAQFEHATTCA